MYLNSVTCLDFIKMACPVKTKLLTLLAFYSKKLTQVEDNTESHSDLEVEGVSLDEQDLSETECDSIVTASGSMWLHTQYNCLVLICLNYYHNVISWIITKLLKICKTSESILHAHHNLQPLKYPVILLKVCINSTLDL